ncbi:30S ribosomal protein S15 [Candidatus Dependentiae bacterium]|nr:30S ribosomal protein S15 [Candidatus Dependentiae bacterium]
MMHLNKTSVIEGYRKHSTDTGSAEVQIALLTVRIKNLTEHFKKHAKDFGSKRGLLIMVGRRRRFLEYLQEHDEGKYKEIIERLGLRR